MITFTEQCQYTLSIVLHTEIFLQLTRVTNYRRQRPTYVSYSVSSVHNTTHIHVNSSNAYVGEVTQLM